MIEISTAGKLALFVAIPTTIVLLYCLLKKSDEEEEEQPKVKKSRQTVIEVTIPQKAVGAVIGRQGSHIKQIQETTGARVHFKDDSKSSKDSDRVLEIRGTSESAGKAELLIRKVIADMPVILVEELYVPTNAVGRIIGSGGENIRSIQSASKCKTYIERSADRKSQTSSTLVRLTGSRQQIDLAKSMIEEKIQEEEVFRAKAAVNASNREQRVRQRKDAQIVCEKVEKVEVAYSSTAAASKDNWDTGQVCEWPEQKEYLEVYVSAMENPGHFWVQLLSSNALQLDSLTEEMTVYYNQEHTKQTHSLDSISVGDIVAAPFTDDNQFYRARVIGFEDDKIDLYFVDYGDDALVSKDDIRQLRVDFLGLPFQAIECFMANVKPKDGEWSEESSDDFEELSYCAKWKVINAKTVSYRRLPSGPAPCLQLIDTNGKNDINLNEVMVKKGYAVWDEETIEADTATAVEAETRQMVINTLEGEMEKFWKHIADDNDGDNQPMVPLDNADWATDYPWAWAYNEDDYANYILKKSSTTSKRTDISIDTSRELQAAVDNDGEISNDVDNRIHSLVDNTSTIDGNREDTSAELLSSNLLRKSNVKSIGDKAHHTDQNSDHLEAQTFRKSTGDDDLRDSELSHSDQIIKTLKSVNVQEEAPEPYSMEADQKTQSLNVLKKQEFKETSKGVEMNPPDIVPILQTSSDDNLDEHSNFTDTKIVSELSDSVIGDSEMTIQTKEKDSLQTVTNSSDMTVTSHESKLIQLHKQEISDTDKNISEDVVLPDEMKNEMVDVQKETNNDLDTDNVAKFKQEVVKTVESDSKPSSGLNLDTKIEQYNIYEMKESNLPSDQRFSVDCKESGTRELTIQEQTQMTVVEDYSSELLNEIWQTVTSTSNQESEAELEADPNSFGDSGISSPDYLEKTSQMSYDMTEAQKEHSETVNVGLNLEDLVSDYNISQYSTTMSNELGERQMLEFDRKETPQTENLSSSFLEYRDDKRASEDDEQHSEQISHSVENVGSIQKISSEEKNEHGDESVSNITEMLDRLCLSGQDSQNSHITLNPCIEKREVPQEKVTVFHELNQSIDHSENTLPLISRDIIQNPKFQFKTQTFIPQITPIPFKDYTESEQKEVIFSESDCKMRELDDDYTSIYTDSDLRSVISEASIDSLAVNFDSRSVHSVESEGFDATENIEDTDRRSSVDFIDNFSDEMSEQKCVVPESIITDTRENQTSDSNEIKKTSDLIKAVQDMLGTVEAKSNTDESENISQETLVVSNKLDDKQLSASYEESLSDHPVLAPEGQNEDTSTGTCTERGVLTKEIINKTESVQSTQHSPGESLMAKSLTKSKSKKSDPFSTEDSSSNLLDVPDTYPAEDTSDNAQVVRHISIPMITLSKDEKCSVARESNAATVYFGEDSDLYQKYYSKFQTEMAQAYSSKDSANVCLDSSFLSSKHTQSVEASPVVSRENSPVGSPRSRRKMFQFPDRDEEHGSDDDASVDHTKSLLDQIVRRMSDIEASRKEKENEIDLAQTEFESDTLSDFPVCEIQNDVSELSALNVTEINTNQFDPSHNKDQNTNLEVDTLDAIRSAKAAEIDYDGDESSYDEEDFVEISDQKFIERSAEVDVQNIEKSVANENMNDAEMEVTIQSEQDGKSDAELKVKTKDSTQLTVSENILSVDHVEQTLQSLPAQTLEKQDFTVMHFKPLLQPDCIEEKSPISCISQSDRSVSQVTSDDVEINENKTSNVCDGTENQDILFAEKDNAAWNGKLLKYLDEEVSYVKQTEQHESLLPVISQTEVSYREKSIEKKPFVDELQVISDANITSTDTLESQTLTHIDMKTIEKKIEPSVVEHKDMKTEEKQIEPSVAEHDKVFETAIDQAPDILLAEELWLSGAKKERQYTEAEALFHSQKKFNISQKIEQENIESQLVQEKLNTESEICQSFLDHQPKSVIAVNVTQSISDESKIISILPKSDENVTVVEDTIDTSHLVITQAESENAHWISKYFMLNDAETEYKTQQCDKPKICESNPSNVELDLTPEKTIKSVNLIDEIIVSELDCKSSPASEKFVGTDMLAGCEKFTQFSDLPSRETTDICRENWNIVAEERELEPEAFSDQTDVNFYGSEYDTMNTHTYYKSDWKPTSASQSNELPDPGPMMREMAEKSIQQFFDKPTINNTPGSADVQNQFSSTQHVNNQITEPTDKSLAGDNSEKDHLYHDADFEMNVTKETTELRDMLMVNPADVPDISVSDQEIRTVSSEHQDSVTQQLVTSEQSAESNYENPALIRLIKNNVTESDTPTLSDRSTDHLEIHVHTTERESFVKKSTELSSHPLRAVVCDMLNNDVGEIADVKQVEVIEENILKQGNGIEVLTAENTEKEIVKAELESSSWKCKSLKLSQDETLAIENIEKQNCTSEAVLKTKHTSNEPIDVQDRDTTEDLVSNSTETSFNEISVKGITLDSDIATKEDIKETKELTDVLMVNSADVLDLSVSDQEIRTVSSEHQDSVTQQIVISERSAESNDENPALIRLIKNNVTESDAPTLRDRSTDHLEIHVHTTERESFVRKSIELSSHPLRAVVCEMPDNNVTETAAAQQMKDIKGSSLEQIHGIEVLIAENTEKEIVMAELDSFNWKYKSYKLTQDETLAIENIEKQKNNSEAILESIDIDETITEQDRDTKETIINEISVKDISMDNDFGIPEKYAEMDLKVEGSHEECELQKVTNEKTCDLKDEDMKILPSVERIIVQEGSCMWEMKKLKLDDEEDLYTKYILKEIEDHRGSEIVEQSYEFCIDHQEHIEKDSGRDKLICPQIIKQVQYLEINNEVQNEQDQHLEVVKELQNKDNTDIKSELPAEEQLQLKIEDTKIVEQVANISEASQPLLDKAEEIPINEFNMLEQTQELDPSTFLQKNVESEDILGKTEQVVTEQQLVTQSDELNTCMFLNKSVAEKENIIGETDTAVAICEDIVDKSKEEICEMVTEFQTDEIDPSIHLKIPLEECENIEDQSDKIVKEDQHSVYQTDSTLNTDSSLNRQITECEDITDKIKESMCKEELLFQTEELDMGTSMKRVVHECEDIVDEADEFVSKEQLQVHTNELNTCSFVDMSSTEFKGTDKADDTGQWFKEQCVFQTDEVSPCSGVMKLTGKDTDTVDKELDEEHSTLEIEQVENAMLLQETAHTSDYVEKTKHAISGDKLEYQTDQLEVDPVQMTSLQIDDMTFTMEKIDPIHTVDDTEHIETAVVKDVLYIEEPHEHDAIVDVDQCAQESDDIIKTQIFTGETWSKAVSNAAKENAWWEVKYFKLLEDETYYREKFVGHENQCIPLVSEETHVFVKEEQVETPDQYELTTKSSESNTSVVVETQNLPVSVKQPIVEEAVALEKNVVLNLKNENIFNEKAVDHTEYIDNSEPRDTMIFERKEISEQLRISSQLTVDEINISQDIHPVTCDTGDIRKDTAHQFEDLTSSKMVTSAESDSAHWVRSLKQLCEAETHFHEKESFRSCFDLMSTDLHHTVATKTEYQGTVQEEICNTSEISVATTQLHSKPFMSEQLEFVEQQVGEKTVVAAEYNKEDVVSSICENLTDNNQITIDKNIEFVDHNETHLPVPQRTTLNIIDQHKLDKEAREQPEDEVYMESTEITTFIKKTVEGTRATQHVNSTEDETDSSLSYISTENLFDKKLGEILSQVEIDPMQVVTRVSVIGEDLIDQDMTSDQLASTESNLVIEKIPDVDTSINYERSSDMGEKLNIYEDVTQTDITYEQKEKTDHIVEVFASGTDTQSTETKFFSKVVTEIEHKSDKYDYPPISPSRFPESPSLVTRLSLSEASSAVALMRVLQSENSEETKELQSSGKYEANIETVSDESFVHTVQQVMEAEEDGKIFSPCDLDFQSGSELDGTIDTEDIEASQELTHRVLEDSTEEEFLERSASLPVINIVESQTLHTDNSMSMPQLHAEDDKLIDEESTEEKRQSPYDNVRQVQQTIPELDSELDDSFENEEMYESSDVVNVSGISAFSEDTEFQTFEETNLPDRSYSLPLIGMSKQVTDSRVTETVSEPNFLDEFDNAAINITSGESFENDSVNSDVSDGPAILDLFADDVDTFSEVEESVSSESLSVVSVSQKINDECTEKMWKDVSPIPEIKDSTSKTEFLTSKLSSLSFEMDSVSSQASEPHVTTMITKPELPDEHHDTVFENVATEKSEDTLSWSNCSDGPVILDLFADDDVELEDSLNEKEESAFSDSILVTGEKEINDQHIMKTQNSSFSTLSQPVQCLSETEFLTDEAILTNSYAQNKDVTNSSEQIKEGYVTSISIERNEDNTLKKSNYSVLSIMPDEKIDVQEAMDKTESHITQVSIIPPAIPLETDMSTTEVQITGTRETSFIHKEMVVDLDHCSKYVRQVSTANIDMKQPEASQIEVECAPIENIQEIERTEKYLVPQTRELLIFTKILQPIPIESNIQDQAVDQSLHTFHISEKVAAELKSELASTYTEEQHLIRTDTDQFTDSDISSEEENTSDHNILETVMAELKSGNTELFVTESNSTKFEHEPSPIKEYWSDDDEMEEQFTPQGTVLENVTAELKMTAKTAEKSALYAINEVEETSMSRIKYTLSETTRTEVDRREVLNVVNVESAPKITDPIQEEFEKLEAVTEDMRSEFSHLDVDIPSDQMTTMEQKKVFPLNLDLASDYLSGSDSPSPTEMATEETDFHLFISENGSPPPQRRQYVCDGISSKETSRKISRKTGLAVTCQGQLKGVGSQEIDRRELFLVPDRPKRYRVCTNRIYPHQTIESETHLDDLLQQTTMETHLIQSTEQLESELSRIRRLNDVSISVISGYGEQSLYDNIELLHEIDRREESIPVNSREMTFNQYGSDMRSADMYSNEPRYTMSRINIDDENRRINTSSTSELNVYEEIEEFRKAENETEPQFDLDDTSLIIVETDEEGESILGDKKSHCSTDGYNMKKNEKSVDTGCTYEHNKQDEDKCESIVSEHSSEFEHPIYNETNSEKVSLPEQLNPEDEEIDCSTVKESNEVSDAFEIDKNLDNFDNLQFLNREERQLCCDQSDDKIDELEKLTPENINDLETFMEQLDDTQDKSEYMFKTNTPSDVPNDATKLSSTFGDCEQRIVEKHLGSNEQHTSLDDRYGPHVTTSTKTECEGSVKKLAVKPTSLDTNNSVIQHNDTEPDRNYSSAETQVEVLQSPKEISSISVEKLRISVENSKNDVEELKNGLEELEEYVGNLESSMDKFGEEGAPSNRSSIVFDTGSEYSVSFSESLTSPSVESVGIRSPSVEKSEIMVKTTKSSVYCASQNEFSCRNINPKGESEFYFKNDGSEVRGQVTDIPGIYERLTGEESESLSSYDLVSLTQHSAESMETCPLVESSSVTSVISTDEVSELGDRQSVDRAPCAIQYAEKVIVPDTCSHSEISDGVECVFVSHRSNELSTLEESTAASTLTAEKKRKKKRKKKKVPTATLR